MPLRTMQFGSAAVDSRPPRLKLVAHDGRLAPERSGNRVDLALLESQRRRTRRMAVLCFGIGVVLLVGVVFELLL